MGDQRIVSTSVAKAPALPGFRFLWKGSVEVTDAVVDRIEGVVGYLSNKAGLEVRFPTLSMPGSISSKLIRMKDVWQCRFRSPPTYEIMDMYFSQEIESHKEDWDRLIQEMLSRGLALKAETEMVKLLVFSSHLLPPEHQRLDGKYYLWGLLEEANISTSLSMGRSFNLVNDARVTGKRHGSTLSEHTMKPLRRRRGDAFRDCTVPGEQVLSEAGTTSALTLRGLPAHRSGRRSSRNFRSKGKRAHQIHQSSDEEYVPPRMTKLKVRSLADGKDIEMEKPRRRSKRFMGKVPSAGVQPSTGISSASELVTQQSDDDLLLSARLLLQLSNSEAKARDEDSRTNGLGGSFCSSRTTDDGPSMLTAKDTTESDKACQLEQTSALFDISGEGANQGNGGLDNSLQCIQPKMATERAEVEIEAEQIMEPQCDTSLSTELENTISPVIEMGAPQPLALIAGCSSASPSRDLSLTTYSSSEELISGDELLRLLHFGMDFLVKAGVASQAYDLFDRVAAKLTDRTQVQKVVEDKFRLWDIHQQLQFREQSMSQCQGPLTALEEKVTKEEKMDQEVETTRKEYLAAQAMISELLVLVRAYMHHKDTAGQKLLDLHNQRANLRNASVPLPQGKSELSLAMEYDIGKKQLDDLKRRWVNELKHSLENMPSV